ncbi:putative bifunctional diguanylate cyclase/phosphodiesterase [Micromonospora echinospora]
MLLCVVAGLVGLLSAPVAVTLAVAVAASVATARLVRLARADRRVRHTVALLHGGVAATALCVAGLPLVAPANRAAIATVGLSAVALLHTLGLLLLPARAPLPTAVRLREVTDAAGLGLSLAFAGWMLLPAGVAPVPVRAALVVAAGGISAVLVTASTEGPPRVGLAAWRGGAVASQLGLTALVLLHAYRAPEPVTLLVAPLTAAGVLLTVAGARRLTRPAPPRHVGPSPVWPRITAPAVIASLGAGYHLARVGAFDRPAIALGLAVIPPLVVRELLTAADTRRYAARLTRQEARFRALVSGGHDLIVLLDDDLRVRWQSPVAPRLFGLTDADVLGRPFVDLLHPADAPRAEAVLAEVRAGRPPGLLAVRMRDGRGVWRETESTVGDQRDVPEVAAVVLHVRDVGERRRLERAVHHLAVTDQLTGLVNRRELRRALTVRRAEPGEPATLLVLDLHGLCEVNDGSGQAVGDLVLVEVAERLRATAGPDDLVARLSGDEFAVIAESGSVPAYGLAVRLLTALTEPYRLPGTQVRLEVSIGVADTAAGSADDVLRQADLARRRASQLGRNRIEWYDVFLEEQLVRRLDLERELAGAVTRGELDLVYQPVHRLADRVPVGTEALLRWRNPLLGTVLPAELIPVAADLGLLDEVGQWVLDRACRQLAAWSPTHPLLWMAVNVTPAELTDPGFVTRVAGTLARHGVEADRLVVEVGEAGLDVDLPTVVARLAGLRSLGVRTALDDFHAGRASLRRLRELPIDLVKVDPRVVGGGEPEQPLIDVVLNLGGRLGLEVVVEELESSGQVDRAYRAGCRYGQGFALSRPATAERVEAFLEEHPSPDAFA